ncbi:hypothetical protein Hanom_Chr04g00332661 [Helianthus anomalus]
MKQFYTVDDPSKRKSPSLVGFRDPNNMDEYLKLKARQAEIRARVECKEESDNAVSNRMQFLLTKVKQLEYYARDLSKEMSNRPPEPDLQTEMRKDLLELIMREKFYPAKVEQFKDWPLMALKSEVNRIERIKNDPGMKKSAPNWSKYKKAIADLALEYKRKKQELVAAKVGTAKAIAKWSRQYTDMAYERLERRRETDPTVPKKPTYKDKKADDPQQQALSLKTLFTSSNTTIISFDHRKRQKQMEGEEKD